MKSILFATLLLTSLFANATSLQPIDALPVITAQLQDFQSNHDWISADTGHITVDAVNGYIRLELGQSYGQICGRDKDCLHHLQVSRHMIELPYSHSYRDGCGSTIYIAEKDQRPVDGFLEQLKVVDHSTIHCRIWHANQTEVEYTTHFPWGGEAVVSYFGGEVLGPLYVLH